VGESSFWYRPTRVVPDQRPLNGRCCCCCFVYVTAVCVCGIVEQIMMEMSGPSRSEQWLYWKSQTVEQKNRLATIRELEKLLQSDVVRVYIVFVMSNLSKSVR